jgi:DNA-binding beta-propeller fold protein YncE
MVTGIGIDFSTSNLYVADNGGANPTVLKLDASSAFAASTVFTGASPLVTAGLAFEAATGDLILVNSGTSPNLMRIHLGSGSSMITASPLVDPAAVTIDSGSGDYFVTDYGTPADFSTRKVYRVHGSTATVISTGPTGFFDHPSGIIIVK